MRAMCGLQSLKYVLSGLSPIFVAPALNVKGTLSMGEHRFDFPLVAGVCAVSSGNQQLA